MMSVASTHITRTGMVHTKPALLTVGFMLAVATRVLIGSNNVAHSLPAGLCFALLLFMLTYAGGLKTIISKKVMVIGLCGAGLLMVAPMLHFFGTSPLALPYGSYMGWALPVTVVALAEEAFLRGTLFDALKAGHGELVAVVVGAVLFTLLHIPLYGWHIVPLDFVVGLWLGELRILSGSWAAPGISHVVTDLLSWWLR